MPGARNSRESARWSGQSRPWGTLRRNAHQSAEEDSRPDEPETRRPRLHRVMPAGHGELAPPSQTRTGHGTALGPRWLATLGNDNFVVFLVSSVSPALQRYRACLLSALASTDPDSLLHWPCRRPNDGCTRRVTNSTEGARKRGDSGPRFSHATAIGVHVRS